MIKLTTNNEGNTMFNINKQASYKLFQRFHWELDIIAYMPFAFSEKDGHESYKEMRSTWEAGKSVIVKSSDSDNAIWGREANNMLRVWHDHVHLINNLDFTTQSEMDVCDLQIKQQREFQARYGVKQESIDYLSLLLLIDIKGQTIYYSEHKRFVVNQSEFVERVMNKLGSWDNATYDKLVYAVRSVGIM